MRYLFKLILFITCVLPLNADPLEPIVMQSGGRLKPLDTVARHELLMVYQKSKIDKQKASAWLQNLLFTAESRYSFKDFKILLPEVVKSLEIPVDKDSRYSFIDLAKGFRQQETMMIDVQKKDKDKRSLVENQLLDTYGAILRYLDISRSLSCFDPVIPIEHPEILKHFGFDEKVSLNYFYFMKNKEKLKTLMHFLGSKKSEDFNDMENAAVQLLMSLNNMSKSNTGNDFLAILPPEEGEVYISPWQALDGRNVSEKQLSLLTYLEQMVNAFKVKDEDKYLQALDLFIEEAGAVSTLKAELHYNKTDYFYKSLYFYLFSFLVVMISWLCYHKTLRKIAFIALGIGWLLHTVGIIMRAVIMQRPPVSTLYESIIFVSFIIVLTFIILEYIKKDSYSLLLAAFSGSLLHFVGFSYADDGDTMGMLVAVLDSNFWLATHVVTITIGYGCSFVAGLIAHAYLVIKIIRPNDKDRLKQVFGNAHGLALVSTFFVVLGTILGGIWADQSWGRFWGWDPKENGALLIALWLLMSIHGKISGIMKPIWYCASLSLTNITVALAWFGVNLLNVGLHSYGFTDSIAFNLLLYCGLELLFVLFTLPWALAKDSKKEIGSTSVA